MNKVLLSLFIVLLGTVANAQVGIVSVPALEVESKFQTGILSTIQASSVALEKAQEKAQALYSTVDWVWDLKSFADFLDTMETVACTTSDVRGNLSVYVGLDLGNSCYKEFEYKTALNKLQMAVDLTEMIVDKGWKGENGDRASMMVTAVDKYLDAQVDLFGLNVDLKKIITKELYKQKQEKGYMSLANIRRKY